jgi:FkbM family methyltransferase
MRRKLKQIFNTAANAFGVRCVSVEWGPRGFLESLRQVRRAGVVPRQIVDVGAFTGTWTEECLTVFPDADYFLIDPLTENEPSLRALSQRKPNVHYWIGALGSQPGTLEMNVHADQSSFLESAYVGEKRKVEIKTLDQLLHERLIKSPDFIKADVQGYELEVLRGGRECLALAEMVLLEVSYRRAYQNCPLAHEVIAAMGGWGFRMFDICTYAQRPRDRALFQSDLLFAKEGSKLFDFEGYA